jgi:phage-related protein
MANDDPTSLRMGFGYHQARASGLGGVRPDRSPNQVNKYVSASKAARQLQQKIQADAGWRPFVAHWLQEGMGAEEVAYMLYLAETYVRLKKRGYSQHTLKRYRPTAY